MVKKSITFSYIKSFGKKKKKTVSVQYLWGQGIHIPIPPRERVSTSPAASSYRDCLTFPKNTPVLWGSPYLMTNQGKSIRTQAYWPYREQFCAVLNTPELPMGKGGLGPVFKLIIVQSPLPNPTLPTSLHRGIPNKYTVPKLHFSNCF